MKATPGLCTGEAVCSMNCLTLSFHGYSKSLTTCGREVGGGGEGPWQLKVLHIEHH